MIQSSRFANIISSLEGKKILLIGDFIADEYIFCETSRVSREAPVLILNYQDTTIGMGGALNVARNLTSLGAAVYLVGFLGKDPLGEALLNRIEALDINADGIIQHSDYNTISKTRILGCSLHTTMQQVLRIDRGTVLDAPLPKAEELVAKAKEIIPHVDAIILSDYGYGSFSDSMLEIMRQEVSVNSKVITADSRYDLPRFFGLSAITPNEPELQTFVGRRFNSDSILLETGSDLCRRLQLKALLVTRGKKGMALFQDNEKGKTIPVFGGDEVADVTGAGDTVIATFTLCKAAGATYWEAALLANCAGGIVVMKRGAATLTQNELKDAVAKLVSDS